MTVRELNVSIVTYKTDLSELATALDSLRSESISTIYIIDNGREEKIAKFCRQYSNVVYIAHDNKGYGSAHNMALRLTMDSPLPYHLVMNSDIRFTPDTIDRLLDVMNSLPSVGALQPRIVNSDGSLQYTVRMLPTPFDLILRRFLPKEWFSSRRDRYLLKDMDHDKRINVPYHQGSFMLLRTQALRECGLFDERFFMYPEDIDLTRRIHRRYATLYEPSQTIVHAHKAASYKSARMLWIHLSNMVRYFNKWGWIRDTERRRLNAAIRSCGYM